MSWPLVNIGSLEGGKGNLVDGPFGSNLKASEYTSSGVPLIQLKNIKPNKYITKDLKFVSQEKADSISRHSYKAGDVCIAKLGAVGTACIIPEWAPDGVIVADVVRFRGDKNLIDYNYFCHYLNSPAGQKRILKLSKGSTRTRTNLTDLRKVEIPLPPLAEQKRIAAILDKADAIRQKRQQAIKLADDFLRSVFLDMFGDPVTNPKGWEVKKLKDITTKLGSGSTPRGGKEAYLEEGISLIRSLNIHNNRFVHKDLAFISDSQAEKLNNVVIEKDDLLLNITGASVCRATLVDNSILPARVNQHVCIVRAKSTEITPCYLARLITSNSFNKSLMRIATAGGATREALTKQQVENLEIILPSLELQVRFENIVKSVTAQVQKAKSQQMLPMFNSLSQKAFAGEL